MSKKKFTMEWWNTATSDRLTKSNKKELHKIIYNNKDKILKMDNEMFASLKEMLTSKSGDDKDLAYGLIQTTKFTTKQAQELVDKYSTIIDHRNEHLRMKVIQSNTYWSR